MFMCTDIGAFLIHFSWLRRIKLVRSHNYRPIVMLVDVGVDICCYPLSVICLLDFSHFSLFAKGISRVKCFNNLFKIYFSSIFKGCECKHINTIQYCKLRCKHSTSQLKLFRCFLSTTKNIEFDFAFRF